MRGKEMTTNSTNSGARNKYDDSADAQRGFAMQAISPEAAHEHRLNAMYFDKLAAAEREKADD